DGVRNVPWQPPSGQRLPSNSITRLLTARDGTLWIGTSKGWPVGRTAGSFGTLSLMKRLLPHSSKIGKVPYGLADGPFPPGGFAPSEMVTSSASETAGLAWGFSVCMRTARAISGREGTPGCGDGNLALQNSMHCLAGRPSKIWSKAMTVHF